MAFSTHQKGPRMKITKVVSTTLIAAVCCGMVGCSTTSEQTVPTPVENVAVEYAQGRTFANAVNTAATRRRWLPQAQADGSIRCTLSQREHLVVVDVVPVGDKAFSIRMVQSNIPVRKYDQWVNNLSREIVLQASR